MWGLVGVGTYFSSSDKLILVGRGNGATNKQNGRGMYEASIWFVAGVVTNTLADRAIRAGTVTLIKVESKGFCTNFSR